MSPYLRILKKGSLELSFSLFSSEGLSLGRQAQRKSAVSFRDSCLFSVVSIAQSTLAKLRSYTLKKTGVFFEFSFSTGLFFLLLLFQWKISCLFFLSSSFSFFLLVFSFSSVCWLIETSPRSPLFQARVGTVWADACVRVQDRRTGFAKRRGKFQKGLRAWPFWKFGPSLA